MQDRQCECPAVCVDKLCVIPDDPPLCEAPTDTTGEIPDTGELHDADTTAEIDLEGPALLVPEGLTASTDRSGDVELTWGDTPGATGYRIERCAVAICADGDWNVLAEVQSPRYLDDTALPADQAPAPLLEASDDRVDQVRLSWGAVTAPDAPRYRYRVVSLGPPDTGDVSAPSASVTGHRAERPVTGYEVQRDDGAWTPLPSDASATSWSDPDAPMATLDAGTVSASQGTFVDRVSLAVAHATSSPGGLRAYRLRAVTAYGPGPASASVSGRRIAGALGYQWERSAASSDADYAPLPGATSVHHDDTGAPADGSSRFYRVVVSAAGAESVTSAAVPGSRQGPADTPGGLAATSDLTGHVRLTWQPVAGASAYHVYRDDHPTPIVSGLTATSYDDLTAVAAGAWLAPASFTASQNQTEHVVLAWAAPTRPLGTLHTYRVSAINAAAEGAQSASASGRRAAPALASYELATTQSGATTYRDVGLVTAFNDPTAPRAAITGGTITATQGEHRAHVALTTSGGVVGTPASLSYQVRGVLADGTKTAPTPEQTGRRAVGTLTRRWQRSASAAQDGFADISCTGTTCNDTTAPEKGERRWFRVELSAPGAETRLLDPVEGWRLAFTSVAGGDTFTCAVDTDRRVWCWGTGHLGWTVATSRTNAGRIPSLSDVAEVAVGYDHACARTATGSINGTTVGRLYCWGKNSSGQLGVGSTTDHPTPVLVRSDVTSLVLGPSHSCVSVFAGGELRGQCWGAATGGALGTNDASGTAQLSPQIVKTNDNQTLMGMSSVASGAGSTHHCTRQSDGGARCWGNNQNGQLGDGTTTTRYGAVAVSSLSNAFALTTGGQHTCAIVSDNSARCWGSGALGRLGHGATTHSTSSVVVSNLTVVTQIRAASESTCARFGSVVAAAVACWGSNSGGQLGGAGAAEYHATPVTIPTLTAATAIGSGVRHHCAIQGGQVYCWGFNNAGQLGDGTATNRNVPTPVVFP